MSEGSRTSDTRFFVVLLVAALASACSSDDIYNVTPSEIDAAKALCDTHGGVTRINTPKPLDVHCTDGLHVRVFSNDR